MLGLVGHIILFILLLFVTVYLVYTQFIHRGAVYYPSRNEAVRQMLSLAEVGKGDTVIDLGSGDGRILIEAAKRGAKAIGYELNPVLVMLSKRNITKAGLSHRACVYCKSFWLADFSKATVITLYQFPEYMDKILKKLREANCSLRVVSNRYPFPNLTCQKTKRKVYLYQINP